MSGDDEVMCYAARFPGMPGYGFITVDLPKHAHDNAKEIAKCIRRGGIVERVSVEAAKAGIIEFLEAKNVKSPKRKK